MLIKIDFVFLRVLGIYIWYDLKKNVEFFWFLEVIIYLIVSFNFKIF